MITKLKSYSKGIKHTIINYYFCMGVSLNQLTLEISKVTLVRSEYTGRVTKPRNRVIDSVAINPFSLQKSNYSRRVPRYKG